MSINAAYGARRLTKRVGTPFAGGDHDFVGVYSGVGPAIAAGRELDLYVLAQVISGVDAIHLARMDGMNALTDREGATVGTFGVRAKQMIGPVDYRAEAGVQLGERASLPVLQPRSHEPERTSSAPPEVTSDEYPILLDTGRTMDHWQTRTRLAMHAVLERRIPDAWVEIHPSEARGRGVRNDDVVSLISRRRRVERIRVRVTSVVKPGQLFVPFHLFETHVSVLTLDAVDPISRAPSFKLAAVRIERGAERRNR